MLLAAHEGGAEAAIDRFDYLRENYDNTGTYDFREQEVNVAAEELAAEGMHEEAIIIFQMNAGRFPSSEAPWVGIGESYEALGDAAGAIEAYEKALSLKCESARCYRATGRASRTVAGMDSSGRIGRSPSPRACLTDWMVTAFLGTYVLPPPNLLTHAVFNPVSLHASYSEDYC